MVDVVTNLSLVVTTYNAELYIGPFSKWLDEVYDYFLEVIIVDDRSSDLTYKLLLKLASRYSRIVLLRTDQNSGRPSLPRNMGIESASADRLVLLDIDDLVTVKYIAFLREMSLVGSNVIYSGVKVSCSCPSDLWFDYPSDFEQKRLITARTLEVKNVITFSGVSLPASLAKRWKFLNAPLEDWLFWRDISRAENAEFVRLLDIPVFYSSIQSLSPNKFRQVRRVVGHLSLIKFFGYCWEAMRLKYEESLLVRRVKHAQKSNSGQR